MLQRDTLATVRMTEGSKRRCIARRTSSGRACMRQKQKQQCRHLGQR